MYKEDLVLKNSTKSYISNIYIYIYIYIYIEREREREDLALNLLSGWYAIKPNQTKSDIFDIYV